MTEEEIGEELARLMQAGGRIAQDFRKLPSEERKERVRDVLERRKVFDFLLEHAQVMDERVASPNALVVPA